MSHHFDEHDHDKLTRWREELVNSPIDPERFPAAVLFLVKPTAAGSHEVFRKYREVFEERDADFANLVVFGMHGVSTTVRALLKRAGLSEEDLPTLLITPTAQTENAIALTLPSGESLEGGDDPNGDGTCDFVAPWQDVLDRIRITRDGRQLRLMGVQGRKLPGVDITRLAESALTVEA
jgi:hypothetical protein